MSYFRPILAVARQAKAGERISLPYSLKHLRIQEVIEKLQTVDADYQYCDDCCTYSTENHEDVDGDNICQDCLDENYCSCDYCSDTVNRDTTVSVERRGGSEDWCESCFDVRGYTCYQCGYNHSNRDSHYDYQDHTLCEACYLDDYFTCDTCSTVFHYDEAGEDGNCQSCDSANKVIKPYSTKAEDELVWGEPEPVGRYLKEKLWFGMELEVQALDTRQDTSEAIAEAFAERFDGRFIMCEDGSLDDCGFEIKPPPLNKNDLLQLVKDIIAHPETRRLRSHTGGKCGLHIHLTRQALSPLQQGKILEFMNKLENRPLLYPLFRRFPVREGEENYSTYAKVDPLFTRSSMKRAWHSEYSSQTKRYYAKRAGVNPSKFSSVNFKSDTVELRLPRGTLKPETLYAVIEFAHALVAYTRTGACNNAACTQEEFLDFLATSPLRMKEWGNLTRFLVSKNNLPVSVLPRKDLRFKGLVAPKPVVEEVSVVA